MVYEYTHYDKYVIEQLIGNVELPLLEFEHNKGYLVSHNLKLISNSSNDLIKLIKTEFRYCFNKDKCTKLLLLILAKDTISIDYDIEEYMHISQYELLNKDIPRRVKEESTLSLSFQGLSHVGYKALFSYFLIKVINYLSTKISLKFFQNSGGPSDPLGTVL